MATNQTNFMHSIRRRIEDLCGGAQPQKDPGAAAWVWLPQTNTDQPDEVNDWVSAELPKLLWRDASNDAPVGTNRRRWADELDLRITAFVTGPAPSPGTVAEVAFNWFQMPSAGQVGMPGIIPVEVFDWARPRLPILVIVVAMARPPAAPVV